MADNNGRGYPSGIYGASDGPPDDTQLGANREQAAAGNDPSWLSGPYLQMSEYWAPIKICVGGTQAFRKNCGELLPIEPKEDEAAWQRRVSHAVLSPFLTRIGEQAAGLILRKPVQLEPKEEGGEVDPYWDDFAKTLTDMALTLIPMPVAWSLAAFCSAMRQRLLTIHQQNLRRTWRLNVSWACVRTS